MMSDQTEKLLRVAQVAERLSCSIATVYTLIESGRLEHHRCPGVRVSEVQLAAYLEATKRGRTQKHERPKRTHPRLRHIKL